MKKIIHKFILLTLFVIYTVFSTGIFISIHHCCLHCHQKVEKEECRYHHDGAVHDCDLEREHRRCHDDHFFFKILDSYDKKEMFFSFCPDIQQTFLYQDYRIFYDTTFFQLVFKEFDKRTPLIKQGRAFEELQHQRVLYA